MKKLTLVVFAVFMTAFAGSAFADNCSRLAVAVSKKKASLSYDHCSVQNVDDLWNNGEGTLWQVSLDCYNNNDDDNTEVAYNVRTKLTHRGDCKLVSLKRVWD